MLRSLALALALLVTVGAPVVEAIDCANPYSWLVQEAMSLNGVELPGDIGVVSISPLDCGYLATTVTYLDTNGTPHVLQTSALTLYSDFIVMHTRVEAFAFLDPDLPVSFLYSGPGGGTVESVSCRAPGYIQAICVNR